MISLKFLCNKLILFFCVNFIKAWEHLQIIPFHEWNTGTTLNKTSMTSVPLDVMLSQTITEPCFFRKQCENILNSKTLSLMIPNFYVSGDGEIYVGHGWDSMEEVNLCSNDNNKTMIEISFIGDFEDAKVSTKQLKAAQKLLEQGILTGKLSKTYDLFGEWQLIQEDSPMNEDIKGIFETWPHWTSDLSRCVFLNVDYRDEENEVY